MEGNKIWWTSKFMNKKRTDITDKIALLHIVVLIKIFTLHLK